MIRKAALKSRVQALIHHINVKDLTDILGLIFWLSFCNYAGLMT